MLSISPIPAFSDNYIWHLQQGDEHWVVDPGEADPVIKALQGASLNGILITHHHPDHTGGIAPLVKKYQCPVLGPASIAGVTTPLTGGGVVTVLGMPLGVCDIPGHTLDHLALILREPVSGSSVQTHLFCGDTLFAAGCGRLFEGTPEQMFHSLAKLSALDATTRVYCAHEYTLDNLHFANTVEPGNTAIAQRLASCQALRDANEPTLPSTIALELATNPFLRCKVPEVMKSAARHAGHPNPSTLDQVALFALLREWKDHF
ncbi:hydroxyacylglutathione hydrolase [uncultured Microbulbifer sp.]|uniref:hydroxyacylglutathione hydrolase n=1 Tax=uncultured Microbulbifer sp. TaxID=348147 RepID=UPI0026158F02|nr:hydroxyacylglutathione hydrolase [uncultured Microbulbifer sp.]